MDENQSQRKPSRDSSNNGAADDPQRFLDADPIDTWLDAHLTPNRISAAALIVVVVCIALLPLGISRGFVASVCTIGGLVSIGAQISRRQSEKRSPEARFTPKERRRGVIALLVIGICCMAAGTIGSEKNWFIFSIGAVVLLLGVHYGLRLLAYYRAMRRAAQ